MLNLEFRIPENHEYLILNSSLVIIIHHWSEATRSDFVGVAEVIGRADVDPCAFDDEV